MRTFTVVPSFEGESAFFELPDIGFQGDHLSFAILFNLTELTEHWPNISPSMIVTDPHGNTFIAPYTSWNAETHIFAWNISNVETNYEGYLRCQLKCIADDDPEDIVCMSRICQTRVYESLASVENAPEAFQSWIDSLTQLGSEISANVDIAQRAMEVTENNAYSAQASADAAEISRNASEAIRNIVENTAAIAQSAQDGATAAQQGALVAVANAQAAQAAAETAQHLAETALDEADAQAVAAANSATSSADYATQSSTYMAGANTAKQAAEAARDAAIAAKGAAETAQTRAEAAESGAQTAKGQADTAQTAAEAAQAAAEAAQVVAVSSKTAAEAAQVIAEDNAEISRKWAVGKDRNGNDVQSTDSTYNNNSKYWANFAKDYIDNANVSSVMYTGTDHSLTFVLGMNPTPGNY